jgi:hypothetical protein
VVPVQVAVAVDVAVHVVEGSRRHCQGCPCWRCRDGRWVWWLLCVDVPVVNVVDVVCVCVCVGVVIAVVGGGGWRGSRAA